MVTSPRTQGEIVLEVENLRTYFQTRWGTVKAVDGVSFNSPRGETLGVGGIRFGQVRYRLVLDAVPGRIVKGQIVLDGEE